MKKKLIISLILTLALFFTVSQIRLRCNNALTEKLNTQLNNNSTLFLGFFKEGELIEIYKHYVDSSNITFNQLKNEYAKIINKFGKLTSYRYHGFVAGGWGKKPYNDMQIKYYLEFSSGKIVYGSFLYIFDERNNINEPYKNIRIILFSILNNDYSNEFRITFGKKLI